MDIKITPEVIEALAFLRKYPPVETSVRQALEVLDNAGVFAAIDSAPERVSGCVCPDELGSLHRAGCPGDPNGVTFRNYSSF